MGGLRPAPFKGAGMPERILLALLRAVAVADRWDVTVWTAVRLIWRHRKTLVPIIRASEHMVLTISQADPQDVQDIHALDPEIYKAMSLVCFAVCPPERMPEEVN